MLAAFSRALRAAPAARQQGLLPPFGRLLSTKPSPPHAPPSNNDRLPVYFPRSTSHKASLEIKRRIMYSIPHMKGRYLKDLVRKHARHGTTNSFVGELESRLDRFLWRCNFVPNIWTARHLIGHKKIMVNGRIVQQSARTLEPHDIVEPVPSAVPFIKTCMRSRLKNNTFIFTKGEPPKPPRERDNRRQRTEGGASKAYDVGKLQLETSQSAASYRRLPPPRDASAAGGAASEADVPLPADARACLDALVPALLATLAADTPLGEELRRRQRELAVVAPAQRDGATAAAPPMTLAWKRGRGEVPAALMELDRVAMRRLLLGLLALQSANGTTQ
mmetsp:Transcript_75537/g.200837  ORF Transcript_75537/g.200837 Transcript_75537/m.200837 type:complete len:333 (+) Transcript_75537:34-1032(+)